MKPHSVALPLAMLTILFASGSHAQNPDPTDIRACTAIESDAQRLACYDHATGRVGVFVTDGEFTLERLTVGRPRTI